MCVNITASIPAWISALILLRYVQIIENMCYKNLSNSTKPRGIIKYSVLVSLSTEMQVFELWWKQVVSWKVAPLHRGWLCFSSRANPVSAMWDYLRVKGETHQTWRTVRWRTAYTWKRRDGPCLTAFEEPVLSTSDSSVSGPSRDAGAVSTGYHLNAAQSIECLLHGKATWNLPLPDSLDNAGSSLATSGSTLSALDSSFLSLNEGFFFVTEWLYWLYWLFGKNCRNSKKILK